MFKKTVHAPHLAQYLKRIANTQETLAVRTAFFPQAELPLSHSQKLFSSFPAFKATDSFVSPV